MAPKDLDSLKQELNRVKSQIQEYEEENGALQKLLNENKVAGNMEKYAKLVQVTLYALALVIGIGIWGMMSSKIAAAERAAQQVAEVEQRVHELEIRQAAESEIMKSIKSDISEIKDELRKLNRVYQKD